MSGEEPLPAIGTSDPRLDRRSQSARVGDLRWASMPLDAQVARHVYDRIGRFQDTQRVYEDIATDHLTRVAHFERSTSVFELGCGTGRYAAHLLEHSLPADATYLGVDVSPKMVSLSNKRLAPWSERARVVLTEPPALQIPAESGAFDRFVATYVFDLLSSEDARALMDEAARLLAPEGLLCLVSLTHGTTRLSRVLSSAWAAMAGRWPSLLGGCQPVDLRLLVPRRQFDLVHCEVEVRLAVPSQVVIARRLVS